MRADQAFEHFVALLIRRGVELRTGGEGRGDQALLAWRVFCDAATESADEAFESYGEETRVGEDQDDDLLLFESIPPRSESDRASFGLQFTRRLSLEVGHDYAGVEEVTLTVMFPNDGDPGRETVTQLWGYAGPPRPDVSDDHHPEGMPWAGHIRNWARLVEASRAFHAFHELTPHRFIVSR